MNTNTENLNIDDDNDIHNRSEEPLRDQMQQIMDIIMSTHKVGSVEATTL